ncbi:MAG: hypothetical protein OHK0052_06330 [Anaerolineales bacterium]
MIEIYPPAPMNNAFFEAILHAEGYAIAQLDARGGLQAFSRNLNDFTPEGAPAAASGIAVWELFPELVGCEFLFENPALLQQSPFQIERAYRNSLGGKPGYVTLRLLQLETQLLLIVRNDTAAGELEQRITQQRNETTLLAHRLERTRHRLHDLLHRFMPGQVAEKMLADGKEVLPGGVRRQVSILFADLRGFTHWSSTREPEVVLATLNSIFDESIQILLEHDATIDKLMGDAIMAFFNAPNDQPNHAQRALACAQALRSLFDGKEPLRFGIGLHTGFAVAGNLGSVHAMQYTIIGDAVNIAKRLEELAGPAEVLLTADFLAALQDPTLPCTARGQIPLRGRDSHVSVYQLI